MKRNIIIISIISGYLIATSGNIQGNSEKETPRIENNNLIVTLDDIKSAKFSTNGYYVVNEFQTCPCIEIEFANLSACDLWGIDYYSGCLFLYSGDNILFDPPVRIWGPSYSWAPVDLICVYDCPKNKLFLLGYFPDFNYYRNYWWYTEEQIEELIKKTEEISILRGEQYKIFLQFLRDTGKLIEDNTSVEPVSPQEPNDISIYPNPTTGELRIRNYELGIRNYETTLGVSQLGIEGVEIYDIVGKKQSTVNCQLSTVNSIDISHLPAGIYFVRITTEKGVFSKKVVKR